jgi:hypothetical protein
MTLRIYAEEWLTRREAVTGGAARSTSNACAALGLDLRELPLKPAQACPARTR